MVRVLRSLQRWRESLGMVVAVAGCGELQQAAVDDETSTSASVAQTDASSSPGDTGLPGDTTASPAGTTAGLADSNGVTDDDTSNDDTSDDDTSDDAPPDETTTGEPNDSSGDDATTGEPEPDTPVSCDALIELQPGLSDGPYTLYVNGDASMPWTAECRGLDGTPRAFLMLPAGPDENFSQYTAGGGAPGTNVRTSFSGVAIEEETLLVDIDNLTFAESTGELEHSPATVTQMPYATAMSCDSNSSGIGRIDLTGTPFVLGTDFCAAGNSVGGAATTKDGGRTADLSGGGNCGWLAPNPDCPFNPFNAQTGAVLQLSYMP